MYIKIGCINKLLMNASEASNKLLLNEQGSGAEDSVGPHSGRPVLLWPTTVIESNSVYSSITNQEIWCDLIAGVYTG